MAAAPLPAVAIIAYLQTLGTLATVRSFYTRAVENEIRTYITKPFSTLKELYPASYANLIIEVGSLRRGIGLYRHLVFVIFLVVLVVFGGLITLISLSFTSSLRWATLLFYSAVVVLIVMEVDRSGRGGRSLFVKVAYSMLQRRHDIRNIAITGPSVRQERGILSYILFPRPEDLIKWIFVPAGFGTSILAGGNVTGGSPAYAMSAWLVLEYLVYAARYQWNDLRGLGRDLRHPQAKARKRLPQGDNAMQQVRNVKLSAITMTLRIVLAGVATWLLFAEYRAPTAYFVTLATLSAAVLAVAVIYEALRSRTRWVPPLKSSAVDVSIWVVVGSGYAIRGCLGFFLGGTSWLSQQMLYAACFFFALGVMFVLITWALDAAQHCVKAGDVVMYSEELTHKSHLAALLLYTKYDRPIRERWHFPQDVVDLGVEPILAAQAPFWSPWNVAQIIAGIFGGLLTISLLPSIESGGTSTALVVVIYSASAVALPVSSRQGWRLLTAMLAAVSIMVLVQLTWADWGATSLGCLPWLALSGTYTFFRGQSYAGLKAGIRPVLLQAKKVANAIGFWFIRLAIGRESFNRVTKSAGQSSGPSSTACAVHRDQQ